MASELSQWIVDLKKESIETEVKLRAESGEDPIQILNECREGMARVGERFQKGDYYLAELMLSGEILRGVVDILEPFMSSVVDNTVAKGTVVLATPRGDIHDLGKNIFATLLRAHGFEVHDLGVDVLPETIVDKVKEVQPDFVGFSALITTAFDSMKQAVASFEESGLRKGFKLMVGGGVTDGTVKDYIKADFQTTNAMAGIAYCIRMTEG